MRAFIVVCLLATAIAAPQGYNYQQQQQQQQNAFHSSSSSHATTSSSASTSAVTQGHSFLQNALNSNKFSQSQSALGGQQSVYGAPQLPQPQALYQSPAAPQQVSNFGFSSPAQQQQIYQAPQQQQQFSVAPNFGVSPQAHQQQQPLQYPTFGYQPQQQHQHQQQSYSPSVTKDIYVHVAPEDSEERYARPPPPPVAPPRKHYRIVFIKAPTHNANKAAVRVNQAPTEEKTIIYVLTKKPDPLDLEAAIQNIQPKQPSKPEVYFIKYKTQEEAQHAQKAIQAEYDKLGGTTQISDEGFAPVRSVIGSLDPPKGLGIPSAPSGPSGPSAPAQPVLSGSSISISPGSYYDSEGNKKYLPPFKH